MQKGDPDRAIADLDEAIRLDPNDTPAYGTRGGAKQSKGDLDGAIVDYARAIKDNPKFAVAYNDLAWLLATAERPAIRDGQRAVESALKACELSQWKNAYYIDTLAAAYARAGKFDDAVKWQQKTMEDRRIAGDDKAAQRLRLYQEGKAWPPN